MKSSSLRQSKDSDGIIQLQVNHLIERDAARNDHKFFCATLAPSMDLPLYAFIAREIREQHTSKNPVSEGARITSSTYRRANKCAPRSSEYTKQCRAELWAYQPRSVGDMSRSVVSKGARPRNQVIHFTTVSAALGVRCLRSIFSLLLTFAHEWKWEPKLILWIRRHRLPGYPRIPICSLAALASGSTTTDWNRNSFAP